MKFNENSLEFIKKTSKMSKEENFALGYIIGSETTMISILKARGMDEEEAIVKVRELFTKGYILDMWNKISVHLELDLKPLYEIFPEFLD